MRLVFLLTMLSVLLLAATCKKEEVSGETTIPEEGAEIVNLHDTISFHYYDRNDVPLAPADSWRNVNTSTFDDCKTLLWKYIKDIYPIYDDNYWDYNIYSLAGLTDDYWAYIDHQERLVKFFQDTVSQQTLYQKKLDCQSIDTTFFLQTIGEPTCKSGSLEAGRLK